VPCGGFGPAARRSKGTFTGSSSNPVAPTIPRNKPFGEHVEGLSVCGDKSCDIEAKVQLSREKQTVIFGKSCKHFLPLKIAWFKRNSYFWVESF
jgi:hypothetical protein